MTISLSFNGVIGLPDENRRRSVHGEQSCVRPRPPRRAHSRISCLRGNDARSGHAGTDRGGAPARSPLRQHQATAIVLYALMSLADVMMVLMIRSSLRRRPDEPAEPQEPARTAVPPAIRMIFDHVAPSSVLATAGVSIAVLVGTAVVGLPLWAIAILTLLPLGADICIRRALAVPPVRALRGVRRGGAAPTRPSGRALRAELELIASHGNVNASLGIFGIRNQEAVHF